MVRGWLAGGLGEGGVSKKVQVSGGGRGGLCVSFAEFLRRRDRLFFFFLLLLSKLSLCGGVSRPVIAAFSVSIGR